MADYYPLLERAVSSLAASTPQNRTALYDRARNALLTQMRNVSPPAAQEDIDREVEALEAAVAKLEAKLESEPAPEPVLEAKDEPQPETQQEPKQEPEAQVSAEPAPAPMDEAAPQPATIARSTAARPQIPGLAAVGSAKTAPVGPTRSSAFSGVGGLASRFSRTKPAVEAPSLPPAPFPVPPPIIEPSAAETQTVEASEDEIKREQLRPAAPLPAPEPLSMRRMAVFGALLLGTVVAIAALAVRWKDNPEDYIRASRPAPAQDADADNISGKIVDRVGGSATGTAPAQQTSRSPSANDTLPVAQRAVMIIEAPDEPQRVKTFSGTTVWRFDTSTNPPALMGEAEIGDLGLRASLRITRNLDTRLPASHILEIRFSPKADSEAPAIKAIDTPQMRQEDRTTGDGLAGVPTPITENFFLVGLSNVEPMASRNLDLIKSRGWYDIPILLTNGRLAKLTLEKGSSGERLLNQALQVWK